MKKSVQKLGMDTDVIRTICGYDHMIKYVYDPKTLVNIEVNIEPALEKYARHVAKTLKVTVSSVLAGSIIHYLPELKKKKSVPRARRKS